MRSTAAPTLAPPAAPTAAPVARAPAVAPPTAAPPTAPATAPVAFAVRQAGSVSSVMAAAPMMAARAIAGCLTSAGRRLRLRAGSTCPN
ncbi:hypothetical protein F3168_06415 [Polymorphobacter fuscus]|uniref:Uncharacterized protein n=1 Tax=Sandarakinorhabdus fusca TaxID=1439888 RepID=A0A7C9KYF2_9SPHN|nr:hypothetical protein F9290_06415 [Polymorphobacter fuscus]MQT16888.1 hypothetical protein [Polymorphobacter fuscus]